MSTQYTNSVAALEPTPMAVGDAGNAISALQVALALLGYYTGSIDGQYGQETERAVAQFQSRYGLAETGSYDADTWYALNFWVSEEQGWSTSDAVTVPDLIAMASRAVRGWLHPAGA